MARPAGIPTNHFALTDLREARGLSKSQVATAAEVSLSYYSEIESGRARPSREVLHRIATAVVCNPLSLERFATPAEMERAS